MSSNSIGDKKPLPCNYSTGLNNAPGQGATAPAKGKENPGGTKPMKPAMGSVPLNAGRKM